MTGRLDQKIGIDRSLELGSLRLTGSPAQSRSHACIPLWLSHREDWHCIRHISHSTRPVRFYPPTVQPSNPIQRINAALTKIKSKVGGNEGAAYVWHIIKGLDIFLDRDSICELFDEVFILMHGREETVWNGN